MLAQNTFLDNRDFHALLLPGSTGGKESAGNVGDLGSITGSGKFPEKREWLSTPVFLPGEFRG